MSDKTPRLKACGLLKSYAVPVLSDFDFELHAGEVHALVGSNGAGKSTFAKIVCGLVKSDAGTLSLDGKPFAPANADQAEAAGIVMVHQELNVIPTLSVAENLFLDRLPSRFGLIDKRKLREGAMAALEKVGLSELDPDITAGELGVGQQQLVEIAASLARNCRLLILDEPTAALTDPEIQTLFKNIQQLQADGVGIIYISHRMDEIRRIANRVTVLRDGRRIDTHEAEEVEVAHLVREMAGHDVITSERKDVQKSFGPVALKVAGLVSGKEVRGVDLEVREGEILGVAGLIGSGRTEFLETVYGLREVKSGHVSLSDGRSQLFGSPAEAVTNGVCMAPEDRKQDGLLLSKSVKFNTTLATLDRHARSGFLISEQERLTTQQAGDRLKLKADSIEQSVDQLSGGNQQKVVLARWLVRDASVLLLDEPTRGIDVPAKELIYELLHQLAADGKAVLVVSSDLTELMALCDRIAVMSAGRIVEEFLPGEWSQEKLTQAALSGYLNKGEGS